MFLNIGRAIIQEKKNALSWLERKISKSVTKNTAFVCPVSIDLKNSMEWHGLFGNYHIVPNVVDTALFKPDKKDIEEFTIIHISSLLDIQKNVSGMLRVAKKLEEKIGSFTWKFIGGASAKFSTLIKTLNFTLAKIEFIDHVSQTDLTLHLQKANLCVSFSNYETFGTTMIEAISCGVPVISTDTGVLTEFEKKDYFKIIPIKDEDKLLAEIMVFKGFKNLNTEEMYQTIIHRYSKKVISNVFSTLYYTSLKI